ncbi:hypothetical protein T190_32175 [Sinorhizobium meliloti CCBAU 01290]|nr:hypothetical protein T190_32175 [Sinorhizobium meliloti CCBAU 01290]
MKPPAEAWDKLSTKFVNCHHREFVAAQASSKCVLRQGVAQPVGNSDNEGVSNRVPPGVIDRLKSVQIDEMELHLLPVQSYPVGNSSNVLK